jgi:hypothetical protein
MKYIFTRDNIPSIDYIKSLRCSPGLEQKLLNKRERLLSETQIKFNGRATSPEELAERLLV